MGMLIWILLGAAAGSVAKFVMPGPHAGGKPVGMALGVAGAMFGGLLGSWLDGGVTSAVDVRSLLMAISGALLVLLFYRAVAMRGDETPII